MKTDFSMRPVMGGLLGGDYNSLTPLVTISWRDESPSPVGGEGRVRVFHKYDDENLVWLFNGQLVGFGGV